MNGSTTPEELLISNINLINCIKPIPTNVKDVVKEGMFSVPNQTGFSELLYFFINLLEPEKCKNLFVWPCINKRDQIKFRIAACQIITEISTNATCDIVQVLKPSLLMNSVDPQATEFMWRLSTYALKQLATKTFPDMAVCNFKSIPTNTVVSKLRTNMLNGMIASAAKQSEDSLIVHKQYVDNACKELREMRSELLSVDNDLRETLEELKTLNEKYEIPNYINLKNVEDSDLDGSIEKWSNKIGIERDELAADVKVLINFEKVVDSNYEVVKDIMDRERRVKLDGKTFQVSIPRAISNQVVLSQNGDLNLESLLKVGFEIVRTLHNNSATIDFSYFYDYLPTVSSLKNDVSLYQTEFLNIFPRLYQFQSSIQRSINNFNYSNVSDSSLGSPLALRDAQTPPFVFSNSSKKLNNVGIPRIKCNEERLLFRLLKKTDEETNVANESGKTHPIIVSRLKQPKKIGLFGSNKGNQDLKITDVISANKTALPDKNLYSTKKINKENVTPKKCANKLLYKSSTTTSKTNLDGSSRKGSSSTPSRRQSLCRFNNQLTTNTENVQRSVSALSLFSSPKLLADDAAIEAIHFGVRELDDPESFNLSKETVPSDFDDSDKSLPTTPSAVSDEMGTAGPSSGVVENLCQKRKLRPSIEALVKRYEIIRRSQKEEQIDNILEFKED